MSTLFTNGVFHADDDSGAPLVGGKLHTYEAGTTTPKVTYSDSALTVPNTNPVILNARGECSVFISGSCLFVLKDSFDVTIWSQDGVSSDAEQARLELIDVTDPAEGAGMVGLNATLAYAVSTIGRRLTERVSVHDMPWLCPIDGVSDCTSAISAAADFAAANGRELELTPGRTYRFSSLTLPANLHLNTGGALLRADGTVTGNATLISFGANTIIDQLNISTPAVTSDRPVLLVDDSRVGSIVLKADGQAGGVNDSLDGAIQIRGSRVRIDSIYVENFEAGITFFGAVTPITDHWIGHIEVKSYVRAVNVRNTQRTSIGFLRTSVASVNATTSPGHNGFLTSGVEDLSLDGFYIADSGEHGIRIGGTNGAELKTDTVTIGNGTVQRPGQCGFKANPGTNDPAFNHRRITVGDITVIDCAATSTTGTNEDAVRVENCVDVTIGKVTALKEAKTRSCNVGIFMAQCSNVYVNDYYIDSPNSDGIEITETSEGVSGAVGAHTIRAGQVLNAGGNSIAVNCATVAVSNILFDGFISHTPAFDAVSCLIGTPTAPIFFRGISYAPASTKHYDGTLSANIRIDIAEDGTHRIVGPTTTLVATLPANGTLQIQDAGFDPATVTGTQRGTIVMGSTGAQVTGIYTPALVGLIASSTRRRWAIAGYAGGADPDQYGIRFFIFSSAAGASDALVLAGEWDFGGNLLPGADNTRQLGSTPLRWSQLSAGTATINTSDEREKEQIEALPDAWLDAWAEVEYSRYRFRDAVEKKGDGARWHVGVIAQRVIEVFQRHDLDPFAAGIVCYDEWGDRFEPVLDDAGQPTGEQRQVQWAGDRYGIRYEEALCLEAALMRREIDRIKDAALAR